MFERSSGHLKASAAQISNPTNATIEIEFFFGWITPLSHKYPHIHTLPASASPIFFTNSKSESPTYHVSTEGNRLLWQKPTIYSNIYYVLKCKKSAKYEILIHPAPHDPGKNKVWQSGKSLILVERHEHQK